MKSHRTLEQRFETFFALYSSFYILRNLSRDDAFRIYSAGWQACAEEINEGEDSDWLQERLYEEGFLKKDNEEK